eukprot:scaffold42995_cov20-Tisochrysis_lutea.AAC.1
MCTPCTTSSCWAACTWTSLWATPAWHFQQMGRGWQCAGRNHMPASLFMLGARCSFQTSMLNAARIYIFSHFLFTILACIWLTSCSSKMALHSMPLEGDLAV